MWSRTPRGRPAAAAAAAAAAGRGPPPPRPPNPNPPPKPPRKNPASRVARKTPPPRSPTDQAQGQAQAQGQGQAPPTSKPQAPPPPLQDRGRDPYGTLPGVGDTRYVPWAEGGNGGTVSQVTVLGDWDEELDPVFDVWCRRCFRISRWHASSSYVGSPGKGCKTCCVPAIGVWGVSCAMSPVRHFLTILYK